MSGANLCIYVCLMVDAEHCYFPLVRSVTLTVIEWTVKKQNFVYARKRASSTFVLNQRNVILNQLFSSNLHWDAIDKCLSHHIFSVYIRKHRFIYCTISLWCHNLFSVDSADKKSNVFRNFYTINPKKINSNANIINWYDFLSMVYGAHKEVIVNLRMNWTECYSYTTGNCVVDIP